MPSFWTTDRKRITASLLEAPASAEGCETGARPICVMERAMIWGLMAPKHPRTSIVRANKFWIRVE